MAIRALVIGDMHGEMKFVWKTLDEERPDLLLCVGDWGDPGQIPRREYESLLERVPVYTVFGNHDDLTLLRELKNRDGSPILLPHGEVIEVQGIRLAGISGIWAKSHRKPYYITDEDVATISEKLKGKGIIILITHGCPIGLADETPSGRRGGQRCFLNAFKTIQPLAHLCGHLHKPQIRRLKSGQYVLNIGTTALGDYALLELTPKRVVLIKHPMPSLTYTPLPEGPLKVKGSGGPKR